MRLDVITGLVPVIPIRLAQYSPKREARDKPGHDNEAYRYTFAGSKAFSASMNDSVVAPSLPVTAR